MEGTPKSRVRNKLSLSGTENTVPEHSTPETSASRRVNQNIADDISPVHSPEWSGHLSQRVYWKWRSPDESARKNIIAKKDTTPKADRKHTPPKPKRKVIHRNYSENLSKLGEEFKSLQQEIKTAKAKTEVEKNTAKEVIVETITGNAPINLENIGDKESAKVSNLSCLDKAPGTVSEDVLFVEITQGLTSLKSFPPNHQFPKVPKLEVDNDMNKSDFTVLMEDDSIEDEMIKCTQQIEEQIFGCRNVDLSEKCKVAISSPTNNNKMIDAVSKFSNYVTSPRGVSSPLRTCKSPKIRTISSEKKMLSDQNGVASTISMGESGVVTWNSVGVDSVKAEEEVLFEDDSFDNIMLELVVETEKSSSPPEAIKTAGRESSNVASGKSINAGENSSKNGDSFGILEDDSIIQPEVLNFLDIVESQAIAASQPLKCTPEEIQKKKIEAKKKLAVGKRKRKSEMALRIANPTHKAKGLVKS